MRVRELYERERLKWSRVTLWLWIAVAYIALVYVAVRWGGHGVPLNIAPSAD